jgi:hypothetical protein|nr:MAG TPA: DNA-directed RNA polymerase II subunit [Caudoviricetes sp.]
MSVTLSDKRRTVEYDFGYGALLRYRLAVAEAYGVKTALLAAIMPPFSNIDNVFIEEVEEKVPDEIEEVIRMEETTVTGIYCYPDYNFPITLYECNECGAVFLDRDDDYQFCPYCGRKITKTVN